MSNETLKKKVAEAALDYIEHGTVLGIGSGSTVNYFIDALKKVANKIEGVVAASTATADKIKQLSIRLEDLNSIGELPLYIDSTDEVNDAKQLIKGGGGALTREKIIASAAKKFICIADISKKVDLLGAFPVALEVIPMARSFVARQIVQLGGTPVYRQGYVTDNGNVILDVHNLKLTDPLALEKTLNTLPGVVENGIFANRTADLLLLATPTSIIKS